MGFVGRKPTNAPLTSDDIPNGIIGAADLAAGLAKITFDTTPKTTGFTAVANTGYFCNTTSAGFTVTLPATPSAGDQVQLVDYAGTFDTNPLIIDPNGEDIEGGTDNLGLRGEREGVILTYIDSTQGWIATSGINEGTNALEPTSYSVDFLVIAGGGAGGGTYQSGGGGAGGYRTSTQTVNVGTVITVTVGDGGTGVATSDGNSGSNSSISGSGLTTITSAGGGGGRYIANSDSNGISGGSGGGVSFGTNPSRPILGGLGNTPSTAPSQGNDGGTITDVYGASPWQGSGGGGAGATGGTGGSSPNLGNGGNGTASSITGSSVTYAGGGGGSAFASNPSGSNGGTGGGGDGDENNSPNGSAGTVNTGGGGGGSRDGSGVAGYSGGKGVVILSVPTSDYSSTTTGSPTVTTSGSNTIMQFNGSGSYTA